MGFVGPALTSARLALIVTAVLGRCEGLAFEGAWSSSDDEEDDEDEDEEDPSFLVFFLPISERTHTSVWANDNGLKIVRRIRSTLVKLKRKKATLF